MCRTRLRAALSRTMLFSTAAAALATSAARAQPSNDLCANAQQAFAGFPYSGFITPSLTTDTTASCAPSANDVWYSFAASLTR